MSVFCIKGHVIHGFLHGELPLSFLCGLMSVRVSNCLRFVARLYTTRVLLSVIGLSSSDFSSIRRYFVSILPIGGFWGLWVMMKGIICLFWMVAFCGCRRSSLLMDAALAMALLTSLLRYPLMMKLPVMVCGAFSNWRSVLYIRLIRRA